MQGFSGWIEELVLGIVGTIATAAIYGFIRLLKKINDISGKQDLFEARQEALNEDFEEHKEDDKKFQEMILAKIEDKDREHSKKFESIIEILSDMKAGISYIRGKFDEHNRGDRG